MKNDHNAKTDTFVALAVKTTIFGIENVISMVSKNKEALCYIIAALVKVFLEKENAVLTRGYKNFAHSLCKANWYFG